jgi:hypothetical protein
MVAKQYYSSSNSLLAEGSGPSKGIIIADIAAIAAHCRSSSNSQWLAFTLLLPTGRNTWPELQHSMDCQALPGQLEIGATLGISNSYNTNKLIHCAEDSKSGQ